MDATACHLRRDPLGDGRCLASHLEASEEALSWLGEAEQERSPELCWIGVRPAFSRLRAHPRFAELVRTIGLPAA